MAIFNFSFEAAAEGRGASEAAAPLATRPPAALAPPAPLRAAFGRTAVLLNPASLAGQTPLPRAYANDDAICFKILKLRQ